MADRIDRIGNAIMTQACEQLSERGWTITRSRKFRRTAFVTGADKFGHAIGGKVYLGICGINSLVVEACTQTGACLADAHHVAQSLVLFAVTLVGPTKMHALHR